MCCLLLGVLDCCGLRVNSVVIDAITHSLFVRFAVCCVLVWLLSCSVWFGLLLVDLCLCVLIVYAGGLCLMFLGLSGFRVGCLNLLVCLLCCVYISDIVY